MKTHHSYFHKKEVVAGKALVVSGAFSSWGGRNKEDSGHFHLSHQEDYNAKLKVMTFFLQHLLATARPPVMFLYDI